MPTMIKVECVVCNKEFEIELKRYNAKIKEKSAFYCSAECRSHKGSTLCKCATCGKEIWNPNSQIARSLTGNVYCSKSCANSMNNTLFKSGENHFAFRGNNYRQIAFDLYEHKCAVCGKTELDDPEMEFRYCSKCNGSYEYCMDHLFTHEHVK